MSYRMLVRAKAEEDIAEAALFYEQKVPALGMEFLSCVDAALEKICRNPLVHPKYYRDFRRALTTRFPFGVFYLIRNDVLIVARVYHLARDPKHIRRGLH